MVSAAQPLTRESCISAGLNMHGTRCPPSISRNAFSLLSGISEHSRSRAPASALEFLKDTILEQVDEPGRQGVQVAAGRRADLVVRLRAQSDCHLIETETTAVAADGGRGTLTRRR